MLFCIVLFIFIFFPKTLAKELNVPKTQLHLHLMGLQTCPKRAGNNKESCQSSKMVADMTTVYDGMRTHTSGLAIKKGIFCYCSQVE